MGILKNIFYRVLIFTLALFPMQVFSQDNQIKFSDNKDPIRGKLNSHNSHKFYIDMRFLGFSQNFNDNKTNLYIGNYPNVHLGLSLYFNNFSFSYSFDPASIGKIKRDAPLNNGDTLKQYDHGF